MTVDLSSAIVPRGLRPPVAVQAADDAGAPRRSDRAAGFTLVELVMVIAVVALLATVAWSSYVSQLDKTRLFQAGNEIAMMGAKAVNYYADNQAYPASLADIGEGGRLDPWGNPYQYHNTATGTGNGLARKDKSLHPLNTDFDLYSKGADGESVSPLTAQPSRDDVVRANQGGYVGLASDY